MTIQKLSEYKITSRDGDFINVECNTKIINTLVRKINTLVDTVNELQATISKMENVAENGNFAKNAQAPYAEQRNDVYVKNKHLIGKLCKFKFGAGYTYGILTNIKRKPSQWAFESNGRAFSYCEPVKPTDSIIYKGTTMSKSIWHRYDEAPKHQDIIMTDTGCWAYRTDLLALETENKNISDKIGKLETKLEKTRKALDVAVDALKRTDWCAQDYAIAQEALNKITALKQKDVK